MCFRHCPEYRNRIGTVCFMETLFRVYRTNTVCTSMKLTGNFVQFVFFAGYVPLYLVFTYRRNEKQDYITI